MEEGNVIWCQIALLINSISRSMVLESFTPLVYYKTFSIKTFHELGKIHYRDRQKGVAVC